MMTAAAPSTDALSADLRDFAERNALNGSDLARLADIHPTTAQDALAGRSTIGPGVATKLLRVMREYVPGRESIERDRSRRAVTLTPVTLAATPFANFQATRAARTVMGVLDRAARKRMSGGISGDPGVGKSAAVRQWSATTEHPHLLVTCRAYTSVFQLVRSIARGVGARMSGHFADLDDATHEELCARPRLLVIDEADMLTARTLDWLRSFIDASDGKTNFVLLGKPAFYKRLEVSHARSSQDLRQVWSRLAFRRLLGGIERAEMMHAIESRGMTAAMEPEAADALYDAIGGSYRDLDMTLTLIAQIVEENAKLGGRITRAAVAKAVESRFGADIGRRRRE